MAETYIKWLRWGVIGGLFASLFIPFIIADGSFFPAAFFPFITGKNFAFRILVGILFGLYVLLALREPKYRPRFSWVLAAVLGFVLWTGVSVFFSVDPVKSFWSNFERMEGYVAILHLFLYFIIAGSVLTAEKLWTRFLQVSVFSSAVMSVYASLQLAGFITINQGGVRLDGTFGNAIYMAVYELFNIFFALFLMSRSWNEKLMRYTYAAIIALNTFILFYTQTRGAMLGLIGGLMVAGLFLLWETRRAPEWKKLRRFAGGALIGVVILAVGFIALRNTALVQSVGPLQRLASISLEDTTTKARFMVWNIALEGFKEKPFFGWGQENFSYVFNTYYDPGMYAQEQWFDRAHNAYLDWLIASGLPGFLLFLSLFIAAALALWRTQRLSVPERAILIGLLAGYAIHEVFVFDNIISYMLFFAVLALAHGISQREVPGRVWLAQPLSQNGMAVAAPLILTAALYGTWYINAGGVSNALGLLKAIQAPGSSPTAPKDLPSNLEAFRAVLEGSPLGRQEATEQLLQFAPKVAASTSVSPDIKQEVYEAAYGAIGAMTAERKDDARLELFFGLFLDQFDQREEALVHLMKAHELSPKKQQIFFELAINNRLAVGDTAGALAALKEAFELDKRYDLARIYYVAVLRFVGENAEADALLVERFGTATPDNTSLLQIYYSTGQYDEGKKLLRARLDKNPSDPQSWIQYAALFYAAGDIEGAVQALQRGAKADPNFADQAEEIIAELRAEEK